MRERSLVFALLVLVSAAPAAAATLPAGFNETLFAGGLTNPTAMAFAPDGRLFICEQGGTLRVVKNGSLLSTPFVSLTVDSSGERGLLGVAFDANFAINQFVYVYYTVTSTPRHNRVRRYTANGDVGTSPLDILDLDNLSSATNHNGGAIHFGPDGKLYVGVGENADGSNSQSFSTRLGKMLRINSDGSIPTDNPYFNDPTVTGLNKSIWALGLRNPFTFAFHAVSGRMFIDDVGESSWEEIDDGIAGSNYGWPDTEGPTSDPRFRSPLFGYPHSGGPITGCAITGGAFYDAAIQTFPPDYANDYFFSDLCSGWIYRFDPMTSAVTLFADGISSPVDLKVQPDGSLFYLARGAGSVFRVLYQPPAASIGDVTVVEGNSGTKGAVFNVTLSAMSNGTVTVNWATQDGTAIAGSDYVAASGVVTFPPGSMARTVTVTVVGDTIGEPDETFFVKLSMPVGATIADGQGVGTIQNDDTPAVRVFVSASGSDFNDCRNAGTPCRTFAQSAAQVGAGGSVIVLDTGSYGGLTLTKAVTIEAPYGVVAFAASPIVVNAGGSDAIVLRGLTVKAATPGSGTGIQFNTGGVLHVERSTIDGWDRGINFAGNGDLYVTDTTIRNSVSAGLRMAPISASQASIDRARFEGTASGCGIDARGGAKVAVRSSVATGNASGFCASAAGAEVSIQSSLVAYNAGNGVAATGGTARVARSLVTGNGTGLSNSAGTVDSLGNSLVGGNGTETSGTITLVAGH